MVKNLTEVCDGDFQGKTSTYSTCSTLERSGALGLCLANFHKHILKLAAYFAIFNFSCWKMWSILGYLKRYEIKKIGILK
jgi:hypothetical protein